MRPYLFFLFVFYLITACSNKDRLPAGILSKKEMQAVMWDMVRSGEFLNGFVLFKDSAIDRATESQKWYDKIYQLHGITKAQFDKSLTYYEQNPILMKEILDSISRKQVYARPYGSSTSPNTADTAKKSLFSVDTRIKTGDSSNKRRILKKNLKAQ